MIECERMLLCTALTALAKCRGFLFCLDQDIA